MYIFHDFLKFEHFWRESLEKKKFIILDIIKQTPGFMILGIQNGTFHRFILFVFMLEGDILWHPEEDRRLIVHVAENLIDDVPWTWSFGRLLRCPRPVASGDRRPHVKRRRKKKRKKILSNLTLGMSFQHHEYAVTCLPAVWNMNTHSYSFATDATSQRSVSCISRRVCPCACAYETDSDRQNRQSPVPRLLVQYTIPNQGHPMTLQLSFNPPSTDSRQHRRIFV